MSSTEFSNVVVFGDSLSDTGNLLAATGEPAPPYYSGRFSNGPVAVEHLSRDLGVPLLNYAWGGATTGIGNLRDGGGVTLMRRLSGMTYTVNHTIDSIDLENSLIIVWGGINDLLQSIEFDVSIEKVATKAIDNIAEMICKLQRRDARSILAPGVPDLSLTPYFRDQNTQFRSAARHFTERFNKMLREHVTSTSSQVIFCDTAEVLDTILAKPNHYGLNNVSDSFIMSGVNQHANEYLFWDDLHPTTVGHSILADSFCKRLMNA
jgi:phospholipase/lecithinase/hemolysin